MIQKLIKKYIIQLIKKGVTMSINLSNQICEPCKGGVPPLKESEITPLITELNNDWNVIDNHHLLKKFTFRKVVRQIGITLF